jgi:hypothetical protein
MKILDRTNVLVRDQYGYPSFRIPAIIPSSREGRVVIACEARMQDHDWGDIDLFLGEWDMATHDFSWCKAIEPDSDQLRNEAAFQLGLSRPRQSMLNNPVLIGGSSQGGFELIYCAEYRDVLYERFSADGVTQMGYAMSGVTDSPVVAVGPGHGVRGEGNTWFVPFWESPGTGKLAHHPSTIGLLANKDLDGLGPGTGQTVKINTSQLKDPSETAIINRGRELALIVRHENKAGKKAILYGRMDNPREWTGEHFMDDVPEAISMTGAVYDEQRECIWLASPTTRARENLVLFKITWDRGKLIEKHVIEHGHSGYADIALLPDGNLALFYCFGATVRKHTGKPSPFKPQGIRLTVVEP